MVQGHVDGVGEIVSIEREEDAVWYRIRASKDILKYVVTKGYIAIDGTSLTVCDVDEESFTIMMIPHTQSIVRGFLPQLGFFFPELNILRAYRSLCRPKRLETVSTWKSISQESTLKSLWPCGGRPHGGFASCAQEKHDTGASVLPC